MLEDTQDPVSQGPASRPSSVPTSRPASPPSLGETGSSMPNESVFRALQDYGKAEGDTPGSERIFDVTNKLAEFSKRPGTAEGWSVARVGSALTEGVKSLLGGYSAEALNFGSGVGSLFGASPKHYTSEDVVSAMDVIRGHPIDSLLAMFGNSEAQKRTEAYFEESSKLGGKVRSRAVGDSDFTESVLRGIEGLGGFGGMMIGPEGMTAEYIGAKVAPLLRKAIGGKILDTVAKANLSVEAAGDALSKGKLIERAFESLDKRILGASPKLSAFLAEKAYRIIPEIGGLGAGFGTTGALKTPGGIEERAKHFALQGALAIPMALTGAIGNYVEGKLLRGLGAPEDAAALGEWLQKPWSVAKYKTSAALAGAIEGLAFPILAADAEFYAPAVHALIHHDDKAVGNFVQNLISGVAGMAIMRGVRPSQLPFWRAANRETSHRDFETDLARLSGWDEKIKEAETEKTKAADQAAIEEARTKGMEAAAEEGQAAQAERAAEAPGIAAGVEAQKARLATPQGLLDLADAGWQVKDLAGKSGDRASWHIEIPGESKTIKVSMDRGGGNLEVELPADLHSRIFPSSMSVQDPTSTLRFGGEGADAMLRAIALETNANTASLRSIADSLGAEPYIGGVFRRSDESLVAQRFGQLYESMDQGKTWNPIETPAAARKASRSKPNKALVEAADSLNRIVAAIERSGDFMESEQAGFVRRALDAMKETAGMVAKGKASDSFIHETAALIMEPQFREALLRMKRPEDLTHVAHELLAVASGHSNADLAIERIAQFVSERVNPAGEAAVKGEGPIQVTGERANKMAKEESAKREPKEAKVEGKTPPAKGGKEPPGGRDINAAPKVPSHHILMEKEWTHKDVSQEERIDAVRRYVEARQAEGDQHVELSDTEVADVFGVDRGTVAKYRVGEAVSQSLEQAPSIAQGYAENLTSSVEPGEYKVRASEVIKSASKLAGSRIDVGHGWFAKLGAAGWYHSKHEGIRIARHGDVVAAIHEAGHALHKKLEGDLDRSFGAKIDAELDVLGRDLYGNNVPARGHYRSEGFAEYVARKLIGDSTVDLIAPEFAKHFAERLKKNPKIGKAWIKTMEAVRSYEEQGPLGRARGMLHMEGDKKPESPSKILSEYRKKVFDALTPLRDAEAEWLKQQGKSFHEIAPGESPFKTATALNMNATGQAMNAVLRFIPDLTGKPKAHSLSWSFEDLVPRDQLDAWTVYAVSKRALQWHDMGREPGISRSDAEANVKQLETPEFREALDRFTEWHKYLLEYYRDAGGLTDTEFKRIIASEDIYITFQRMFEAASNTGGYAGTKKLLGGMGAVKKAEGSFREIKDPIVSAFHKAHDIFARANKLLVQKALYRAVHDDAGSAKEGSGWFMHEVDGPEATDPRIIKLSIEGKDRYFQVDDDVMNALTQMDKSSSESALAVARWFSMATRVGATGIQAGFTLTQMWLDAVQAYTNSQLGRNVFSKLLPRFHQTRGLIDQFAYFAKRRFGKGKPITGLGQATEQFKGLGGDSSTWAGNLWRDPTRVLDQTIKPSVPFRMARTIKHPFQALREGGLSLINYVERFLSLQDKAARISEFKGMQKQLKIEHPDWTDLDIAHEAMLAGKDLTINFARQGTLLGPWNRYAAYTSSFAGAISKASRSLFSAEYGIESTAATWLKSIAAISVPSMVLWWLNKDRKWYGQLTDQEKAQFFFFGDEEKPWFKLRRPEGIFGDLFSRAPEAALEYFHKQDPGAAEEAMWLLLQNISPVAPLVPANDGSLKIGIPKRLIPNLALPFIEVQTNTDWFTNKAIDSESDMMKKPESRVDKRTTQTAAWLGQALGISPKKIEVFLRDTAGSLPLDALRFWDVIQGNASDPKMPVLQRFFARDPEGSSQQTQDFYSKLTDLQQKHGSKIATPEEEGYLRVGNRLKDKMAEIRKFRNEGNLDETTANKLIQDMAETFLALPLPK